MKQLTTLLFLLLTLHAFAQLVPESRSRVLLPPPHEHFQLYLLAGQSNMAGRGKVEVADTIPNKHILLLNKSGEWEIAKEPVHDDKRLSGLGPGLAFARELYKRDTTIFIGLIPCAVSGSSIKTWLPATVNTMIVNNYSRAVSRAIRASADGDLEAVLWNQGETDCTAKGIETYEADLISVIQGIRRDLKKPELLFIGAELPQFQKSRPDKNGIHFSSHVDRMNSIIIKVQEQLSNFRYISSVGTSDKGDHLHYDSVSARLLGKRYAEAVAIGLNANGKR